MLRTLGDGLGLATCGAGQKALAGWGDMGQGGAGGEAGCTWLTNDCWVKGGSFSLDRVAMGTVPVVRTGSHSFDMHTLLGLGSVHDSLVRRGGSWLRFSSQGGLAVNPSLFL